jgi:hyaluronan synthase
MGGDDARLTTLVLEQGYKTVYQDNCVAMTPFTGSFFNYIKQKTRWSRNSFRTYIKSIFSRWPWKQRRFYYIMAVYHTLVPGLTLIFGLFFFAYTVYLKLYLLAFIWILWVLFSRFIKGFSHLKKNPKDIFILPFVVLYFYILGFIKVYAFFTMTKESWAGSRDNYTIKNGVRVMTKKN